MARLAGPGGAGDAATGLTAGADAARGAGTPERAAGATDEALRALIDARLAQRTAASRAYFGPHATRIAALCHRVAERFARGGRLLALGASPAARSDVRHVTVEFVHPVIVGKRALPALGLTAEGGALDAQVALLARPEDVAIGFEAETPEVADALAAARARGALTLAFAPSPAEWVFAPPMRHPFVAQELVEVFYHVLWELSHVFFEHRGLLAARDARPRSDAGASSFLYPFLAEDERDLDGVLDDVARSVRIKTEDTDALRARTLESGTGALIAAARVLRRAFDAGGVLHAFGNGGSATDAMDLVADLRAGAFGPPRAALDLTEDAAVLTALANDIGADAIFARQLIAHGRPADVALAFSTSGNSLSILDGLAAARRIGMTTIALLGDGGGRVVEDGVADHVILSPSSYVPRVQEAHASAAHVLVELVERVAE